MRGQESLISPKLYDRASVFFVLRLEFLADAL